MRNSLLSLKLLGSALFRQGAMSHHTQVAWFLPHSPLAAPLGCFWAWGLASTLSICRLSWFPCSGVMFDRTPPPAPPPRASSDLGPVFSPPEQLGRPCGSSWLSPATSCPLAASPASRLNSCRAGHVGKGQACINTTTFNRFNCKVSHLSVLGYLHGNSVRRLFNCI